MGKGTLRSHRTGRKNSPRREPKLHDRTAEGSGRSKYDRRSRNNVRAALKSGFDF